MVVVIALLGACGGSDDDGNASSSTAPGLSTTSTTQALVPGGSTAATFPGLGGQAGFGQGPPAGAACAQLPPKSAPLAWLPPDLPFPTGSYPTRDAGTPQGSSQFNRGLLAVKGTLQDFVRFALREWPKNGWVLGRGESEPGEAEDSFFRQQNVGAFRARTSYCDKSWTEVFIVYGQRQPPPTAPPTTAAGG